MALGSMAVSAGQPSDKLEARLQHLSAGARGPGGLGDRGDDSRPKNGKNWGR